MKKFTQLIGDGLHEIERTFFPDLEYEAGPIPKSLVKLGYLLQTIRSCRIPLPHSIPFPCGGFKGRPPKSRHAIFNAFIAKSFLQIPTTTHLIERLQSDKHLRLICGFEYRVDVPSNSVFSRVFKYFSDIELPQKVHELLVKMSYSEKIVGHLSRDSTTIEAREKPAQKTRPKTRPKRKKGRPRKGESVKSKEPTRVQKQLNMSLEEMLKDLPKRCDIGSKKVVYHCFCKLNA